MKELEGKAALVTGSCIGLGAAVARRFAEEGARVCVTGYPADRGEALAKELGGVFVPGDLRNVEETRALARTAVEKLGGLDILVNNAAVSHRATLEEFSPELFDAQFQVIVRAPLLLAQAALPALAERKGVILNIGSVNAEVGWPNLLVYAAAKGALVTASRNLANALKYRRVRVHCLNPGWIDTEGERAMMTKLGHPPDFLDREGEGFPLGRLMKPEELAHVALLLASDKAAAFSGAVVDLEQFPFGALCHPKATEQGQ
jgi:NAD(P)-dependent dehydrogenase (short-subunit alcohol dehydrogenase family)